jgi:hypothetical protein
MIDTADQHQVCIESLTVKSANSLLKSAARLSPPDSSRIKLHPCFIVSSSQASMFAVISSRIAACGQPPASQLSQLTHHHHAHSKIIPVSTATIRSGSSALCLIRNSPSSRVKISFVTAHKLYLSRSFKHNASIKAVFNIYEKHSIEV